MKQTVGYLLIYQVVLPNTHTKYVFCKPKTIQIYFICIKYIYSNIINFQYHANAIIILKMT